jgi:hypothetical protein
MPAGTGSLNFQQILTFLSQSAPSLSQPGQITVQFPGKGNTKAAANPVSLTAGSGAGQYNSMFINSYSSSSPTVLNLTNTLTQPDGTLATFADLILIAISCPTTNSDYVSLGAGTDFVVWMTTAIKIYPGQTLITTLPVATGLAVTTTTADRVTITPNSGTQAFTIMLAGH